ncbi:bifunctional diaminohydroxyphosphoribosylaminopyrimidine deaminase/5-amino-6-(5-phosphoribosylamino)uracil reductase RibD [Corynebacterium breve]|uniref:Riboflavin biosynthesis protein RibD n=1 Tax=Corynebacterium breve TaxID=3049799 RepID=A0ABY8VH85_9CORY|nr:bifunctional diaminohydroxyphosphoribosylaminopyrimidine deaminase/5-amino-6-(5-phosphoribosylamino)uracil reductase RibD [Corynebacterium breve]WIM69026.1 bifunctional diaminohydroxyphosphoribosylaminopyrimidine deaminase/5-amino-6-(5-phosphoribosylamino)uracil reductase RibD [Corynebacterium breve]
MHHALEAGDRVRGTTSPNPPVGCAIVDDSGVLISTGGTSPAGGPHAEVNALSAAGDKARGATAIVTLEPCNHTGRTGPCSHVLLEAGITKVVYLTRDTNPNAVGGADYLADHGVEVDYHPVRVEALQPWLRTLSTGRPHVTVKFAASIDGFTAAADGTSQWITGKAAREHVHKDRLRRDAIIVGTGTALADDPSLTARHAEGIPAERQPRRVVVGKRAVREGNLTRLGFEQYSSPEEALKVLWDTGARDVLVEGGASLATSFIQRGLVDRVQAYLAPMLMGAGRGVLTQALAPTLSGLERMKTEKITQLGDDVLVEMVRCLPDL